jgi:hypothetical protein
VSLLGFNGANPDQVWLTLAPGVLADEYGTSPIPIDGGTATWSSGGLIIDVPSATPETVGPQRHWIPISAIAEIQQKQPDPFQ